MVVHQETNSIVTKEKKTNNVASVTKKDRGQSMFIL